MEEYAPENTRFKQVALKYGFQRRFQGKYQVSLMEYNGETSQIEKPGEIFYLWWYDKWFTCR